MGWPPAASGFWFPPLTAFGTAIPWAYDSSMVQIEFDIRHLYISPSHNFFGHHGKEPADHSVVEVDQLRCVAGEGIEGDRFFGYREDYKGQITFFAEEIYEELCAKLNIWDRSPAVLRRNVITRGVALNDLIGQTFEIQGVQFYGREECRPCYWMDRAFGPGAEVALKGNGGLRASISRGGILRRAKFEEQSSRVGVTDE
jgi:hypothetical protein